MSNDKEFEETKVKSEIYIKSFGHISNLEERGLAQDAFSTAWDYQQKIIERLRKERLILLKKVQSLEPELFESVLGLMEEVSANRALSEVENE